MIKEATLIFGYNDYAKEIIKQMAGDNMPVYVYTMDPALLMEAEAAGCNVALFDLSDDWDEIARRFDTGNLRLFCTLQDDAENIFLTISLRAAFKDIFIVALARNQESARKLRMAGADKTMPILQTTANIITERLEKPIVMGAVHDLLYGRSEVMIEQMVISENSPFVGKRVEELDDMKIHNIIIFCVADSSHRTYFAVTKKGRHHQIAANDIIIIIGYNNDIEAFKLFLEGREKR
jgi:Trk K+ transport system NAD-binding subunit